jgi:uncharacterized membrane protein
MSLAPLLEASGTIPLHAFAAMAAFALGIVQFAAPKGTLPHRTVGWIWVGLMAVVAASSFWIHEIRHRVADHRRIMIMIFVGALVIAGLFTFVPGRIMHAVFFGP